MANQSESRTLIEIEDPEFESPSEICSPPQGACRHPRYAGASVLGALVIVLVVAGQVGTSDALIGKATHSSYSSGRRTSDALIGKVEKVEVECVDTFVPDSPAEFGELCQIPLTFCQCKQKANEADKEFEVVDSKHYPKACSEAKGTNKYFYNKDPDGGNYLDPWIEFCGKAGSVNSSLKDVPYIEGGKFLQKMDITFPVVERWPLFDPTYKPRGGWQVVTILHGRNGGRQKMLIWAEKLAKYGRVAAAAGWAQTGMTDAVSQIVEMLKWWNREENAAKFNVNPRKVSMLGYSLGASLASVVVTIPKVCNYIHAGVVASGAYGAHGDLVHAYMPQTIVYHSLDDPIIAFDPGMAYYAEQVFITGAPVTLAFGEDFGHWPQKQPEFYNEVNRFLNLKPENPCEWEFAPPPTAEPTAEPTPKPTPPPSAEPTTAEPTAEPTMEPTPAPTTAPTEEENTTTSTDEDVAYELVGYNCIWYEPTDVLFRIWRNKEGSVDQCAQDCVDHGEDCVSFVYVARKDKCVGIKKVCPEGLGNAWDEGTESKTPCPKTSKNGNLIFNRLSQDDIRNRRSVNTNLTDWSRFSSRLIETNYENSSISDEVKLALDEWLNATVPSKQVCLENMEKFRDMGYHGDYSAQHEWLQNWYEEDWTADELPADDDEAELPPYESP